MKKPEIKPEDVQKWREEAMQEWLAENATEDKVKARVRRMLDGRLEQIVKATLGFSKNSWNDEWAVDHCNGRAGESAAGDFIRKHAAQAVREWLGQAMDKLPKPTASISKAMRREYDEALRRAVHDHVRAVAANQASSLAASILGVELDE